MIIAIRKTNEQQWGGIVSVAVFDYESRYVVLHLDKFLLLSGLAVMNFAKDKLTKLTRISSAERLRGCCIGCFVRQLNRMSKIMKKN